MIFRPCLEDRMNSQASKKGKSSLRRTEVPKDLRFQDEWATWFDWSTLHVGATEKGAGNLRR